GDVPMTCLNPALLTFLCVQMVHIRTVPWRRPPGHLTEGLRDARLLRRSSLSLFPGNFGPLAALGGSSLCPGGTDASRPSTLQWSPNLPEEGGKTALFPRYPHDF